MNEDPLHNYRPAARLTLGLASRLLPRYARLRMSSLVARLQVGRLHLFMGGLAKTFQGGHPVQTF